jgi:hypothetical protein
VGENTKSEVKKARLKLYLASEKAILSGQSYEIEGLKLTRANLKDVQNMIVQLENQAEKLDAKQRRARLKFVVPKDGW